MAVCQRLLFDRSESRDSSIRKKKKERKEKFSAEKTMILRIYFSIESSERV